MQATSILFSSFESWLVAEHNKNFYPAEWLSQTLSFATLLNGITVYISLTSLCLRVCPARFVWQQVQVSIMLAPFIPGVYICLRHAYQCMYVHVNPSALFDPRTLNPQPSTVEPSNPQSSTLNRRTVEPSTLNPQHRRSVQGGWVPLPAISLTRWLHHLISLSCFCCSVP
jgi:hypothetical protein